MILGITAGGVIVPPSIDPFFANVVSLIHWDGADASTTYVDQIPGRTWTNGPNGGTLVTAEKKFGSASLKFTGAISTNQVNSDNGAAFTFGTGDFTIEWWFRTPSNIGTIMMWDQRGPGGAVPCIFQQGGQLLYYVNSNVRITGSSPMLAATWQHYAVSRVSGSTLMFCDGIQIGSTYADATNYVNGRVRLGTNGDTGGGFGTNSGWYDDIRVTKGVGRYTANFTPPTDAFPSS